MSDVLRTILDAAANEAYRLPSGLTVLVRRMPGFAAVHAIVAARFGSIDLHFRLGEEELTLPAGAAHYLEHKMFEDQEGDAFALFAKTGANANAFTTFDRTCYYFTATREVDRSLDVLLGMITHPYFTRETVDKERGIIAQEIKMYADSPDWRIVTELCQCLYHSHPIRSDIAGSCQSIAEITPEMLYDCCRAFYAPANLVLSVAGDIDPQRVLDACARAGLDRPTAAPAARRLCGAEPETLFQREKTLYMAVSKPCFGVGFKETSIPEGDSITDVLYDLVVSCIAGGMSGLYRRLYDGGLIEPSFDGEVMRVDGCCCILFTGESDTPETVRDMLLEEIERVRAEGVDREIFTLCKSEMYGRLVENLESVEDAASQMADFAMLGQTVPRQIELLAGLTAAAADAALQKILRPERMAFVRILPAAPSEAEEE